MLSGDELDGRKPVFARRERSERRSNLLVFHQALSERSSHPGLTDSISEQSPVPDFSILFYPVISMDDSIVHRGSRQRLLGSDEPNDVDIAEFSTETRITDRTPPTYLIHCEDDEVVPIENSKVYFDSLQRQGIESELHVYEKGGHGIGAMNTNPEWESQLNAWLARR